MLVLTEIFLLICDGVRFLLVKKCCKGVWVKDIDWRLVNGETMEIHCGLWIRSGKKGPIKTDFWCLTDSLKTDPSVLQRRFGKVY